MFVFMPMICVLCYEMGRRPTHANYT